MILRHTEYDRDWLQLSDSDQGIGIAGMDDVAGIDQPQSDSAGYRSSDMSVSELQLGIVHLSLIELQRAFVLMDGGGLGIELLFWDGVFGKGFLVPLDIQPGVFQQRRVAG